jgi:hypothetical protein
LRPDGLYAIEDMQKWDAIAMLLELEPTFRVVDLRSVKSRYDDVLMVWTNLVDQSQPAAVSQSLQAQRLVDGIVVDPAISTAAESAGRVGDKGR